VVRVRSGGVVDEISQLFLGRMPEAVDGTYLWEVFDRAGEILRSSLIPIATDTRGKQVAVPLDGFLPLCNEEDRDG
jgi:hypothetical protein